MRAIIAFIDNTSEAALLRGLLENMGWRVAWRPIGKPSDLLAAFDEPADLGVICGHGDAGGLVFPPMAYGVDALHLPDDRMTPDLLSGFTHRLPAVVMSTACGSGTAAFADAFTRSGVSQYIAPIDYPDGAAVPVLIGLSAYLVSAQGLDWSQAIAAANAHVAPENRFHVFSG